MAVVVQRLAFFMGLLAQCSAAATPPHVVLLVFDDLGWADVGYHKSMFPTPNIDSLATAGVRLERFYVMPQCSPTRAAMITGRYSFRTGLQHYETIMPGATPHIPDGTATIAETFKAAGYATHMIGKWHLGYSKWSQTPTGRGFDSHYGYLGGMTDYYNATVDSCGHAMCLFKINKHADSPAGPNGAAWDFWLNRKPAYKGLNYTVDAYGSRLRELLEPYRSSSAGSSSPKPLFLYYAEQQVHIPLQAPKDPKYLERCRDVVGGSAEVNRTVLCSMASRLDDSVGELVQALKDASMWENTLLFAVSDNGGMTHWSDNFPASASSNWPLRGGKTTLFEGGVRAAAFVSGGALPEAARGSTRTDLLHAVDILPTLATFAKVPLPSKNSAPLDGLNAWPTISAGTPLGRVEIPLNIGVNPLGGLPYITPGYPHDGAMNFSALISWPWKFIMGDTFITMGDQRRRDGWWSSGENYSYSAPTEEDPVQVPHRLYNLEEDESENHNLASVPSLADVVRNLTARIKYYASKESGWVKPQSNMVNPLANPRFHKWTWAPFLKFAEEAQELIV